MTKGRRHGIISEKIGIINDKHKDRLFCFLFGREENRDWTLSLYNAVNGTDEKEDRVMLRLSDAFPFAEEADAGKPDIEVTVTMLNINHGRNRKLMEACKPLAEYAWFIDEIRRNRAGKMELEAAVDQAINDMPDEYVIKMCIIENRAEVKRMCITEYDEAETMRLFKEEWREEGEDRLGQLIDILLANKRTEDIQKAAVDKAAREKLYKEFHIISD